MKIEFRDVIKAYGRVRALDRVSITIDAGQVVGLLGANGAGKSTFLRCIYGIVAPDRGRVFLDDQAFGRQRMDLRRRMHFLPEFPLLFGQHSIVRNIAIVLRLFEADGGDAERRVLELLRELDLLPLAKRPVASLSRGQAYKTTLAALIAADPEVWLLDEPVASGMDPHGIDALKRHARAAAKRGRTIVYSTQFLDVAERCSDRICVIDKGAVRAFETLNGLRERATDKDNVLVELFRSLRETNA